VLQRGLEGATTTWDAGCQQCLDGGEYTSATGFQDAEPPMFAERSERAASELSTQAGAHLCCTGSHSKLNRQALTSY